MYLVKGYLSVLKILLQSDCVVKNGFVLIINLYNGGCIWRSLSDFFYPEYKFIETQIYQVSLNIY